MALSYKNDNDADERLNPASQEAKSIHDQEQQAGYDRDFNDMVENNDSLADLKDKEESGGWVNNVGNSSTQTRNGTSGKLKGFLKSNKNKGALAGVIGGTGIIGLLFTLFGPMSMIISLTENLLDTNDAAQSSFQRRITKVLGLKMSGQDAICDNATTRNVKCKMGRMTTKGFQKIANKGVVAYDADGNDLSKSQGKYPNKTVAYYEVEGEAKRIPAKDIKQHLADNPRLAAKLLGRSGAFNVRFDVWRGKHMKKQFYDRWGIKRDGGLANGDVKDTKTSAVLEKLKGKVPGLDGLKDKSSAKISAKTEKMVDRGKKGGIAYLTAVGSCIGIKAPNIIASGVAAVQAARLMPLTSEVIVGPGSITKAAYLSNPTPEAVEGTLNTLTATDKNNQSATDSEILQSAIGVNTNKAPISKDFAPGYSLLTSGALENIRTVENASEGACNVILSPQAMYTAMAVNSIATVAASSTIIGGIVKVGAEWAVGAAAGYLAKEAVEGAAAKSIDKLAENDELDKVLGGQPGKKLGDALGTSAMVFFASGAASRHVPVLKKSQLTAYNNIQNEEREFERQMDLATLSPFDLSSKYTFFGSIVHSTNTASIASGSMSHPIAGALTQFAISPLKLLSPTSFASKQSTSENYCGYAEEFDMAADDNTTPGVNAAGLPCYGYVGDISTEDAIEVATGGNSEREKWVKDDTSEDATLEEVVESDSRLNDYIEGCGAESIDSGEWTNTAAGCTIETAPSNSSSIAGGEKRCKEGEDPNEAKCYSGDAGDSRVKASTAKESEAIAAFAIDYQISQNIDGYDEEPLNQASSGDGKLTVMTWNTGGKKGDWSSERKKEAAEGIATLINERQPDIIATQETTDEQAAIINKKIDGYGRAQASNRSVYFKKSEFKRTDRADLCFPDEDGSASGGSTDCNRMLLVRLKSLSTDKDFYVASVHPDSKSEGNQLEAAKRLINRYNLADKSIPVIIAGDMNDNHNENGSKYLMDNGFDLTYKLADKKINDDCESASNGDGQDCGKKNPRIIDHIYITSKTGATVPTWENIKDNSSDHNPIVVTMKVPGLVESTEESTTAGGWQGNESSQGFQWPANKGKISGCWRKPGHAGIDIGTPSGTSVYAAKSGTVVQAGNGGDAGNYVMIKHDNGLWSNYQHNTKLLVKKGDKVKTGQEIAKSGSTGYSTGPHIHFGVTDAETLSSRRTGTNSLNPAKFLPSKPGTISGMSCS